VTDWLPFATVVADVTGGNTKVQLRDYARDGEIPIIDQGKSFIGGYTNDKRSAYLGPLPCVIFGDHTKAIKYVDFTFALGADGVKILAPRSAQLDAKFLYYFLRTHNLPNAGYSRHFKFLKEIQVPFPPLEEQRRTVSLLDRAAEIRRRADAARAKARAIIASLFLNMFGDPATNSKGWPEQTVGEAGEVKLGRQRAPKYQSGKFTRPYVRVANVFENRIDVSDLLSMDFDERDFAAYRLSYGDILLNEGQSLELVGRPAMWRDEVQDCCFQNTLVCFKCDPDKIVPDFALAAFLRMYKDGHLSKIASKTSNVAHLGAGRFAKLPIVVPPLTLQIAFAEKARSIDATARALDAAAAKAEAMAAALSASIFDQPPGTSR
jgi:type I restriction enzyme S subunit